MWAGICFHEQMLSPEGLNEGLNEGAWHRGMSVLRDWVTDVYEFSKSWITVKKLVRRNMFF